MGIKERDESLKIIDSHAHVFPSVVAEKASDNIGDFYHMPMRYDGKVSTLLSLGEKYGIDQFMIQSVATVPSQVKSINSFIARAANKYPDKLIGFASMHAEYPHIEKEVERIFSLGLKGIKIHPDFQKFNIDDKKAFQIYEMIEGRLPILIHTGDYRYEYSKPERILRVIQRFPKLDIICAHFGGWSEWEKATALAGQRIWVDTSSSLYALTPRRVREFIDLFGVDRVLFGSDYPMWNPGNELQLLSKVELSDEEKEKILHKNLELLLGLA